MGFVGKVAVVTGGGSGMDAATAWRLAREGAAVVVADVNRRGGAEVAEKIRAAGGRQSSLLPTSRTRSPLRRWSRGQ